jgi:nucleotide-binding universal stress UspA family protein
MPATSGFRSVVIGVDGSANSRRAVAAVARLRPPARGRVVVVRVVEPVRAPSLALLPGRVRAQISAGGMALDATRLKAAQRDAEAAARRLRAAGWRAQGEVRQGVPLHELLRAVRSARGNLLAVGARGIGGIARLLLGSVAEGAVRRSPVSVLVVR